LASEVWVCYSFNGKGFGKCTQLTEKAMSADFTVDSNGSDSALELLWREAVPYFIAMYSLLKMMFRHTGSM